MLMPASSEFIALCRSQVALLTNGLGAALSIVYLTEELADATDAKLVPIVAYPEAAAHWQEEQIFSLFFQEPRRSMPTLRLLGADDSLETASPAVPLSVASDQSEPQQPLQLSERALLQQQVVLPLMHQDVVVGLLVTARADRAWTEPEQTQIEQIANTLAAACLLDQRAQWLSQDLRQQQILREQRHDLFDNLLHQFRNPLTALRTFGKLLAKRLKPEDANRSVAEGIVRESDRLQELLQQFDAAIDLDEIGLRHLLNPVADEFDETSFTKPERLQAGQTSVAAVSPPALPPASPLLLPSSNRLVSKLDIAPHPVITVLQPLLETAETIAQDRQLTLHTIIPAHLPPVKIDPRALREVLNNLVDNALKYTPSGGQMQVQVQSQPVGDRLNQQAIVIADTGPGIPSQDLERLFERHYRGVQSTTNIPGTGLGLAIARELVHQMQGDIQIFSPAHTCSLLQQPLSPTAPNSSGTAVVVWLPETYPA